jgi:hypothetical protein
LIWVLLEAAINEVNKLGRPFPARNLRWVLVCDTVEDTVLLQIDVRGLTLGELNGKDSKTPNINLIVVLLFTFNHLGCHPAYCSNLALALGLLLGKLDCIPKIS